MVTLDNSAVLRGVVPSLQLPRKTSANSTDSFAQQLATALESFLSQSGNNSHLEIDIQPGQSQNSGKRQFIVTVKDPDAESSAAPATSTSTHSPVQSAAVTASAAAPSEEQVPVTPKGHFLMDAAGPLINSPSEEQAATVPVAPKGHFLMDAAGPLISSPKESPIQAPKVPDITPTDAYWAEQPEPVQALRDMPEEQRYAAAQELASQGYAVDVPIMIWGWDPLVVMAARQDMGFTWVPSANQANIPVMPGMSFPGLPGYDPKNGPAGSIKVSTDFAKAATVPDLWMKDYKIG